MTMIYLQKLHNSTPFSKRRPFPSGVPFSYNAKDKNHIAEAPRSEHGTEDREGVTPKFTHAISSFVGS